MVVTFADELVKNCPHDKEDRVDMGMLTWRIFCLYCNKLLREESKVRVMNC